jgi:hypothetical protein
LILLGGLMTLTSVFSRLEDTHTALERQRLKQRLDRTNLLAFAASTFLGQAQTAGRGVGADRVPGRIVSVP